jgi:DNA-binding IclR family transcriptional regulator
MTRRKTSAAVDVSAVPGSKIASLIALLSRSEGASVEELAKVTGWQSHSVRGALAGSLKRKGYTVTSEKTDGVRRYRIGDQE